jgi:hypothetical protein
MSATLDQLQSIQSMLAAGHRSVRLERHSLILTGGVGGFVAGGTEYLITAERFPDLTQRALVLLVWLGVWLGGLSLVDHYLTRRARARRDETLPFAQAQITRAWWMLLGMGTLGSCAMFFYGGGPMIYGLWIVLLGLGIYLFGLFSRPLIEWIGLATILLGVVGLAAGLPYQMTHWLAASCFVVGMPLAGWLDRRQRDPAWGARMLALLLWMVAVVGAALLLARLTAGTEEPPRLAAGERVLQLAPGTPVALTLDLSGPLMGASPQAGLGMHLKLPVEVVLHDGEPDGRYRINNGPWHRIRDGVLGLKIHRLKPGLGADGQPVVRAEVVLDGPFLQEDTP